MSVNHVHAMPAKAEGSGCPSTRVIDDCEQPCRCWGKDPGPLEKQPLLLTAKPSLQSQADVF